MRKLALAAVLALAPALVLSGCHTPCPITNAEPVVTPYVCEDGSHLTVTYYRNPDRVHIEQEGYAPLDLTSRISGSGYRFADQGAELRGRSTRVRWSRPGAAETQCEADLPGVSSTDSRPDMETALPGAQQAATPGLYRQCGG